jgi:hypothetical protein
MTEIREKSWSVIDETNWPRNRFEYVVLISHRDQIDLDGVGAPGTLTVATDFLTWCSLRERGIACVHYEAALGKWPDEAGDPDGVFADYCNWMMDGDVDLSLFQGVPLGRLFNVSVGFVARAWLRMWHGLDSIIARAQPREIIFYDAYPEFGMLEAETRRNLVRALANRHDTKFTDRFTPLDGTSAVLPEVDYDARGRETAGFRLHLRNVFAAAVDVLTGLRAAFDGLPRVLLIHNWNTLEALLNSCDGPRVCPAVPAAWVPKRPKFLIDCLRRGVRLLHVAQAPLNDTERAELIAVEEQLRRKLSEPADGPHAAVRDFVLARLIGRGDLAHAAAEVKAYRKMIRRSRPARILVGDIGNYLCRLVAEVGHSEGIPTDELVNGMFITGMRWDARNGERGRRPLVARQLTWGVQQEDWIRRIGAPLPTVRTGYPALDKVPPRSLKITGQKALVLPLSTECGDTTALRANIMTCLIDVVGRLVCAGWQVRVKLHPGRPVAAYYKAALNQAGIAVEVTKDGSLADHLEWADVVVGPLNTGAFVETLAYGRPYFGVCPLPSSVDARLCGPAAIYDDPAVLVHDLINNKVRDPITVLDHFCDRSMGLAAPRVWSALESAIMPVPQSSAGASQ